MFGDWWDKVRKPAEKIAKEAAEQVVNELLNQQLTGAMNYLQRKRSAFTTAIEKKWQQRGLKTANREAAAAAVDAIIEKIL